MKGLASIAFAAAQLEEAEAVNVSIHPLHGERCPVDEASSLQSKQHHYEVRSCQEGLGLSETTQSCSFAGISIRAACAEFAEKPSTTVNTGSTVSANNNAKGMRSDSSCNNSNAFVFSSSNVTAATAGDAAVFCKGATGSVGEVIAGDAQTKTSSLAETLASTSTEMRGTTAVSEEQSRPLPSRSSSSPSHGDTNVSDKKSGLSTGESIAAVTNGANITEINENDVLCGRGGETNHHPGNVRYRALVKRHQRAYLAAKRRDKPHIARLIVDEIRRSDPPGRFLKKDLATGSWYDVGNGKAREKTSQALREGAPELRSGGSSSNAEGNSSGSDETVMTNEKPSPSLPGPSPIPRQVSDSSTSMSSISSDGDPIAHQDSRHQQDLVTIHTQSKDESNNKAYRDEFTKNKRKRDHSSSSLNDPASLSPVSRFYPQQQQASLKTPVLSPHSPPTVVPTDNDEDTYCSTIVWSQNTPPSSDMRRMNLGLPSGDAVMVTPPTPPTPSRGPRLKYLKARLRSDPTLLVMPGVVSD